MPIPKGPNCFGDVMKEFKAGVLSSGKNGPKVKDPKQAKAIASSMCNAEEFADGVKKVVYGEAMAPLGYPHPNVPAKFLQGSASKQKANGHKQPRPTDVSTPATRTRSFLNRPKPRSMMTSTVSPSTTRVTCWTLYSYMLLGVENGDTLGRS